MKELVVLSGKGGTGKTTLMASFAALASNKVIVDCDVDAADLHLVLEPQIKETHEFSGGKTALIDKDLCIGCGKCRELCRSNAINEDFQVNELYCEGCSACMHFCPVNAITMQDKLSGHWFVSDTDYGSFVHAKLGIAEDNSGKLVTLIRSKAKILAEKQNADLIMCDGSPGIGCPVIASITGTNLVLIVVEPTLSGIHDLSRVVQLTKHFQIKTAVCINKFDVNTEMSEKIEYFCKENDIQLLGKLPYDSIVTKAQVSGQPVVSFTDTVISQKITDVWEKTYKLLNN